MSGRTPQWKSYSRLSRKLGNSSVLARAELVHPTSDLFNSGQKLSELQPLSFSRGWPAS
jgi:hypothetical protein